MLLIFPPVAKPCEPPAGIARLSGTLQAHGIPFRVLDANLEGLISLLAQPEDTADTWSRRAAKNVSRNVAALRDPATYGSPARYSRAVSDISRLLANSGRSAGAVVGLADYRHLRLSPVRSADLLSAAEHYHENPYYPWFSRRLPEILEDPVAGEVRVAGFSLNYLSQALCTFAMIGYLREHFAGLRVIVGGGLVSSWMKRPGWRNPFTGLIDQLVAGPGETFLLDLFGADELGSGHVPPKYDLFPLTDYLSPGFILPYSAAGGCYWNHCTFCPERAEGNPYRPLPARQVMTDLRSLAAAAGPALIHIVDNAISPALLHELAVAPLDVPWYGFARFGHELADADFCRALKRSGCVMLKLGLESGDQGVLDRLGKGIEIGVASRVLRNLQQAGIAVYLYLLFGTPAETETEARRTLEFVVRHREAIGFLNLALFNMPVCGSEAAEYDIEPFYEGDLSLYAGFVHPGGWGRKQVRRFLADEFKSDPAVAAILRNDPPVFTSNHAPFFFR